MVVVPPGLSLLEISGIAALNDRRAARDYLDIHALLSQPVWTPARLFTALRDSLRPVITAAEFRRPRRRRRPGPEDYHAYELTDADIARLAAGFPQWAAELRTQDIDSHDIIRRLSLL